MRSPSTSSRRPAKRSTSPWRWSSANAAAGMRRRVGAVRAGANDSGGGALTAERPVTSVPSPKSCAWTSQTEHERAPDMKTLETRVRAFRSEDAPALAAVLAEPSIAEQYDMYASDDGVERLLGDPF